MRGGYANPAPGGCQPLADDRQHIERGTSGPVHAIVHNRDYRQRVPAPVVVMDGRVVKAPFAPRHT